MVFISGNADIDGKNYWLAESVGSFTVEAIVDDIKSIPETIETNNSKTKTFKVYEAPPFNLALNKSVTTSSVENSSLQGAYAVDGNYGSRWSSQFSDPQWIKIDFGAQIEFNQIRIYWETAYAKDYKIEFSNDNSAWTTIVNRTDGNGGVEKFDVTVNARYLRILGTKRATEWGYSIYEIEVFKVIGTSSAEESYNELPFEFTLSNNYPNPFNPTTKIKYTLPKSSNTKFEIFNSIGELVNTLVNEYQNAGNYEIIWDGKDESNMSVSSGVYFYRMNAEGFTLVKKMVLLK